LSKGGKNLGSSKDAPMNAPYCADCRGKDDKDCRKCNKYPLNIPSKPQQSSLQGHGKSIIFKDGKYHYAGNE